MNPFTEEAEKLLFDGKYSKWARGIDVETLHVLFWMIGELSYRSDIRKYINKADGWMDSPVRRDIAMETILRIFRGEKFSGAPIEAPRQVLSDAFERRRNLSQGEKSEYSDENNE